jgi:hypothetical protein
MSSPQSYLTINWQIKLHYYTQSLAAPYFVKKEKWDLFQWKEGKGKISFILMPIKNKYASLM